MSDAHYTCDFFFLLKRSWFASLDSSHALPHLSNYFQVSEQSYGCHLGRVRNAELSERLAARPFFLSIASPRGTVNDGSGSEFWTFACNGTASSWENVWGWPSSVFVWLGHDGLPAAIASVSLGRWKWRRETSPSLFLQGILMHPRITSRPCSPSQEQFLKNSKQTSRVCFVLQFLIWPGWIHCELWKALVVLDLENRHSEKGWRWIQLGPWGTFGLGWRSSMLLDGLKSPDAAKSRRPSLL